MDDTPPPPSKAEMEKLVAERKNDLPQPQPAPRPKSMGEDHELKKQQENFLKNIAKREERIQHIADRLAKPQDRARNDFAQAKTQGMAKDAFNRSR